MSKVQSREALGGLVGSAPADWQRVACSPSPGYPHIRTSPVKETAQLAHPLTTGSRGLSMLARSVPVTLSHGLTRCWVINAKVCSNGCLIFAYLWPVKPESIESLAALPVQVCCRLCWFCALPLSAKFVVLCLRCKCCRPTYLPAAYVA